MNSSKEQFYHALKVNNGKLNELELGAMLGLNEDETMQLIAQLLTEFRITHTPHGACDYMPRR